MTIYKSFLVLVLAFFCLHIPFSAHAQQPRFENPERINKLCEQSYNTSRKTKDCACFVEKYKIKEKEMFDQRGTGTVPSYDNVFRLIENECHLNNDTGSAKLEACQKDPDVQGLTSAQIDTYCKCQGKAFSEMEVMFSHMPNVTDAQKKEITGQMNLAAKHKCKDQAKRKY